MSTEFPPEFDDLLNAQFATLATIGKDGGPQLTEVWFLFEEGKMKVSLNDSRLKTKNLRARPPRRSAPSTAASICASTMAPAIAGSC